MGLDRFRILFDQAPVCMHEIDADGRLLAMNPAGLAMMGVVSEEAIRGLDYLAFVSPLDRDRVRCLMAEAFAGQAYEFEFCAAACEPATAHPRHFTSCFIPCPDALGNIDRLIGISGDDHGQQELPL